MATTNAPLMRDGPGASPNDEQPSSYFAKNTPLLSVSPACIPLAFKMGVVVVFVNSRHRAARPLVLCRLALRENWAGAGARRLV